MVWIGWTLVAVIFILPLALLCYSGISTGIEIWRKGQPIVDSFFDALYFFMFRHPNNENPPVPRPSEDERNREVSPSDASG